MSSSASRGVLSRSAPVGRPLGEDVAVRDVGSGWGRRAAGLLAAGALVMTVGCASALAGTDGNDRRGAARPVPHLPTVVNAPGTWSDEEGVRGPVAALGIALRTRTDGIFDDRQSLAVFAVSAVDGSASWLRLPGFSLERWGFVGGFTVSPDGRWLGWVRPERPVGTGRTQVAGWSVMNTTTGRVRQLEDPDFPSVRGTMADLAFSGDSRYLLTSYETPDQPSRPRANVHQLVAWDVEDGTPTVVEEPGHHWLPNPGSAPTGVTWARGRQVFRADPATGEVSTTRLPGYAITASWGPDDTSFAYISRSSVRSDGPWRLYAGRTVAEARGRAVDLPPDLDPDQLLGWRDADHVVVGHFRRTVHVVDIVTGDVEEVDLAGYGEQINAPYLADALWQQPLGRPAEPESTTDPRRPWRWAGAAALVAALGAVLVRRLPRRRGYLSGGQRPRQ